MFGRKAAPESLAEFLVISEIDPVAAIAAAKVTLDCVRVSNTSVTPEKLALSPVVKCFETIARRFPPESSCGSDTSVALPESAPEKSEVTVSHAT